jgi:hypothetical protein
MNLIPGSGSNDNLFPDYPTNLSYITVLGAMAFSGQLIVANNVTGETSHFELKSTFKSTPWSVVGSPTVITIGEDVPGAVIPKITIGGAGEVIVNVTNYYQYDVQCVCYVRYTETFFFI